MNNNFGDFLLFSKVITECRKMYGFYEIYTANVDENFYSKYIEFDHEDLGQAVDNADIIVLAGGGYFGEPNKFKTLWDLKFLKNHALPIIRAVKANKPICIIGVGFGPLSNIVCRRLAIKIFNSASKIVVRDACSKEYLMSYGFKKHVDVFPDIILGCSDKELLNGKVVPEKYKGKFLIHLTTKCGSSKSRMSLVVNELKEEIALIGKENVLVITDQHNDKQYARAEHIATLLGLGESVYYYDDPYELCAVIKNALFVITDKLHVGIVATKFSVPVLSVAAHPKTIRFYDQIGRQECCIPLEGICRGDVKKAFGMTMKRKVDIDCFVELSKNNSKILSSFLSENT